MRWHVHKCLLQVSRGSQFSSYSCGRIEQSGNLSPSTTLFPCNGLTDKTCLLVITIQLAEMVLPRYWWTDLLAVPWRNQHPLRLSLFHRGILQPFVCAVIRKLWLVLNSLAFQRKGEGMWLTHTFRQSASWWACSLARSSLWAMENDIMILLDLLINQEKILVKILERR